MHSLMYAAYLARNPSRQYDVAWTGLTYSRSSASGARGSVAFSRAGAVALFYDAERFASRGGAIPPAAPAPAKPKKSNALEAHLQGVPDPLARTAKDELISSFELTIDGKTRPVVTAAFWSDREGSIVGARPWARLVEDGAHLVAEELDKPEKALEAWAARYGLSAEKAEAVHAVFFGSDKLLPAAQRVTVPAAQRATLGLIPNGPTRELLQGAGIVLE
jgi:hypothetical protein